MTALSKERVNGAIRFVRRDVRPLAANVKVLQGALAVAVLGGSDRGHYKQGMPGAGLVAVGRFTETVDNTGGAVGAKSAEIEFFRDRTLFLLKNDAGTAVVAADRESACYVLDDQTVTGAGNGNSRGGTVYDVTTEGVWVEIDAERSPDIQTGTSTLVAGTVTISGVKLTSGSRILLTMKDPGAGAITGFADLDAPAANRNVGAGSFVVNAIDAAKATIATAVCTFDWMIVS